MAAPADHLGSSSAGQTRRRRRWPLLELEAAGGVRQVLRRLARRPAARLRLLRPLPPVGGGARRAGRDDRRRQHGAVDALLRLEPRAAAGARRAEPALGSARRRPGRRRECVGERVVVPR